MEFIVHDTLTPMAALLEGPQAERPDALRAMLAPMREAIPMPGDAVDLHHQSGGFRVDRSDPRYLPAVRRLISDDLIGQFSSALSAAFDLLKGYRHPDLLRVMFVLGDPDDAYLMNTAGGYYGMGGAGEWLYVVAWPTEENIARIAYCAVHEFHHNLRYHNVVWDPAAVTVGEHVVAEGLAEAFVRELAGPGAMGPWSSMVRGEAFDRALKLTMADIDLQGMQNTPAFVLGDSAMARFGQEPRGIPDMAGYAVGLHLVDRYLAATGKSAVEATGVPGAEIIAVSRDQRGDT